MATKRKRRDGWIDWRGSKSKVLIVNDLREKKKKEGGVKISAAQESLEQAKTNLLLTERAHNENKERIEVSKNEVRLLETKISEKRICKQNKIIPLIEEYKEMEKIVLNQFPQRMLALANYATSY